jgi:sigma-B regulation protein RsbU (phosphoserine phosphatase)
MPTPHVPRASHVFALMAWLFVFLPVAAQTHALSSDPASVSFDQERQTLVSLDRPWRFHTGDDPRWAEPSFDDSSWSLVRSDKNWDEQGYKNYTGTAWYRLKVQIPANQPPLSLYVLDVNTNYQVYVDGRLSGGYGEMPPHAHPTFQIPVTVPLPHASEAHTLSLAVRVWMPGAIPGVPGGGLQTGMLLGRSSLIAEHAASETHNRVWRFDSILFLSLLEVLGGNAALALFIIRRKQFEYLWFGLFLLAYATFQFLIVSTNFHAVSLRSIQVLALMLVFGMGASLLAFFYSMLRARPSRLFWIAVAGLILSLLAAIAFAAHFLSLNTTSILQLVLAVPSQIWVLRLLFIRVRQRDPDARLLLLPILIYEVINNSFLIVVPANLLGLKSVSNAWLYTKVPFYFPVSLPNLADILFLIAMFAILIHRFARSAQHQERFAAELEAARIIQQILIPEALPTLPGFAIQTAYLPAGSVGGDFFQILPLPGNSLLIAIGDVSGKGLPAAMTVSLLVGTLRTVADYTQAPGEILAALNSRMVNRSNGGFTTCLVLRADPHPDGSASVTLANAGHLAPYLDGVELTLHNGLPLGILAGAVYAETTQPLAPTQQLTLLTDGVVEARTKPFRNKPSELFGFARTATLSTQSANQIATTAQKFGQDDDITVLTLTALRSANQVAATP